MRIKFCRDARIAAVVLGVLSFCALGKSTAAEPSQTIPCRVMEVASSSRFHVRLAVFHYLNEADRAQLGKLLRENDGSSVEFRTVDGNWQNATVIRLKTCFGRGLLLFPISVAPLAAKDEILIRFP